MNKFVIFMVPVLAALTACSSVPNNNYDKRAEKERELDIASNKIIRAKMPDWYQSLPKVNNAVLSQGIGISVDPQGSVDKAKLDAYKSICMAANGKVDMDKRNFTSEVEKQSIERFEVAVRAMCEKTAVRGVELAQIDGVKSLQSYDLPNGSWVSFVLIALPTGTANVIQTEYNRQDLSKDAAKRADRMFDNMDKKQ